MDERKTRGFLQVHPSKARRGRESIGLAELGRRFGVGDPNPAATTDQAQTAPAQPAPGRSPKSAVQDSLFDELIARKVPVELVCFEGHRVEGVLKAYDAYGLIVTTSSGDELVFKHGIIGIRPAGKGQVTFGF